jgi:DNA (cytosine-5)-methyltransferase 1
VLNSEWLGVPQARKRVIFVGVREDLNIDPVFPKPLPYNYTMKDALPWIAKVERLGGYEIVTNCYGERESRLLEIENKPFPTVMASQMVQIAETAPNKWAHAKDKYQRLVGEYVPDPVHNPFKRRYPTTAEMKQVCSYPDDFVLTGKDHQQWERLGRSVPPMMMCHIATAIKDNILCRIPK